MSSSKSQSSMAKQTFAVFVLLVISDVFSIDVINTPQNHFEWFKNCIEYIRSNAEGSLDIVLLDNPATDEDIRTIFNEVRHFLDREAAVKVESLNTKMRTRRRLLFVLDGSNFRTLQLLLQQIHRRNSILPNKILEYYLILSTSELTFQHTSLFQTPLSNHVLFIQTTNDNLAVHRISAADSTQVRSFNVNSSFERIFDDRPDWYGYEVLIWTVATRLPFAGFVDGKLTGVDIEACKTVFKHANMSHQFLVRQLPYDYWKFRKSIEQLLRNNSIHLVISRMGFANPYGEILVLRDTDGSCLLVPRSLQRNFIYHLVHPFEFDTWMVVGVVIFLDMILGLFFPIAFPHNLIMILLFGDSLADHEQTRWTRFYCFACTIFLFLLSEAYLAKAIIYMTLTRYAPDMKTMAEFIASDIPILITSGAVAHLNKSELLSQLLSKAIEDPNFYFHLDSDRYAYIVLCSFGKQLLNQQLMENYLRYGREGKRRFYLVEERIQWEFNRMLIQYRFMYYGRFKEALSRLHQAGLWDKWINDIQRKREQRLQYELRDDDDILFLEDLVAIWYVVGVGWTVSGLTFLVELVWKCSKRNCRRIRYCFSRKLRDHSAGHYY